MEYCKENSNNNLELKILVYLSKMLELKGERDLGEMKAFQTAHLLEGG